MHIEPRSGRRVLGSILFAVFFVFFGFSHSVQSQTISSSDIKAALSAAYGKFKGLNEGKNADYIPALAKVPSNLFGIALITPDGQVYTEGNVDQLFSIQSIS